MLDVEEKPIRKVVMICHSDLNGKFVFLESKKDLFLSIQSDNTKKTVMKMY